MARSCQVEEDAKYSATVAVRGRVCIDVEMGIGSVKKMIG
jgi:hypothetical protein